MTKLAYYHVNSGSRFVPIIGPFSIQTSDCQYSNMAFSKSLNNDSIIKVGKAAQGGGSSLKRMSTAHLERIRTLWKLGATMSP